MKQSELERYIKCKLENTKRERKREKMIKDSEKSKIKIKTDRQKAESRVLRTKKKENKEKK